jgi:hypothetical protein
MDGHVTCPAEHVLSLVELVVGEEEENNEQLFWASVMV